MQTLPQETTGGLFLPSLYTGIKPDDLGIYQRGRRDQRHRRLLEISTTTLIRRIISISKNITAPHVTANAEYEVDEIKTFVGRKKDHIWVAYALNCADKSVVCFSVGPRTNETLSRVTDKLTNARLIYTDKLRQYKTLISPEIHRTAHRGTNVIT